MNITSNYSSVLYINTSSQVESEVSPGENNPMINDDFHGESLPQPLARKGKGTAAQRVHPKILSTKNTGVTNKKNTVSGLQISKKSGRRNINSSVNRPPAQSTSISQGLSHGTVGEHQEGHHHSTGKMNRKNIERKKTRVKNKSDADNEKYVKVKEANYRFGTLSKIKESRSKMVYSGLNRGLINETNISLSGDGDSIGIIPSCLYFHDVEKASLQMSKMRKMQFNLPFCVEQKACEIFEYFFTQSLSINNDMVLSLPVRQELPDYAQQVELNKFRGMGQFLKGDTGRNTTIGQDSIYSVLNLAVLTENKIKEMKIYPENILSPGTFKVIKNNQLDGKDMFYFAYCILAGDVYTEVNADIVPINENKDGEFSLTDSQTGYSFKGKDLNSLVDGIKSLTGLSLSAGSHSELIANATSFATSTTMLFMKKELLVDGEDSNSEIIINKNINVFSPVYFHPQNSLELLALYKNTFAIRNNTVIYASQDGEGGIINFLPDGNEQYKIHLDSNSSQPGDLESLFIARNSYTLQEISSRLTEHGMLQVMDDKSITGYSNRTFFEVLAGETALVEEGLSVDYNNYSLPRPKCNSCFSLVNNRLDAISETGDFHSLNITRDIYNPGYFQISSVNRNEDVVFFQRLGLDKNRYYQLVDIDDVLYGMKMIKVPDLVLQSEND